MKLQDNLIACRKKKKLSQKQVADFIGVSESLVIRWENGATMPGIDSLIEISNFFDVTIDYLVKDIELEKKEGVKEEKVQELNGENQTDIKAVLLILIICIGIVAAFMGYIAGSVLV